MSSKKELEKNNIKNVLCYVPLVSFILFFVETNKSKKLMKHIKYGSILFILYIILKFFLVFIGGLITIFYILISLYLGYKAYAGEDIEIEYIDKLEGKIKDNMNSKEY